MSQSSRNGDHIEGVPEGYRLKRIGMATNGESWINRSGNVVLWEEDKETDGVYPIVELIPIEPEQPKHDLAHLIEIARNHVPTEQEKRDHAISFVYGNLKLDGCDVTREMVAKEYDNLHVEQPKQLEADVYSIPDEQLVGRAVRSARDPNSRKGQPHMRWVAVMEMFALGSTYSKQLCRRFGLDPDEKVKR